MLSFKRFQILQHAILAAILVALCNSASAKDLISRTKSPAQNARIQYDSKSIAKSFNFFGSTASLDKNGDWSIEGTITHNGMLCADYEIGLRFGAGSAEGDCTDVEWLTMDEYVLTQTLCNNATTPYRGVLHDDYLAENFEKISCVERVVRCTGNCK